MSKVCNTQTEAINTQSFYLTKGVETFIEKHNDKWLVYRKEDNKVLKSINYKEVNFDDLL